MWQQVTDLLFLENCKKLVSSSKDTNVRVWDLDTQSCVQRVVSNRSAVWSLDLQTLNFVCMELLLMRSVCSWDCSYVSVFSVMLVYCLLVYFILL